MAGILFKLLILAILILYQKYEFNVTIPNCGTSSIYWTKVCGDPLC